MTMNDHAPEDHSPDVSEVMSDDLTESEWPLGTSEREPGFQVAIRQSVLNDIHDHAASSLDAEICGVLVGDVAKDDDGPFVHVEASIRGEFATGTLAGVTFTAETWTYVQEILEARFPDKKIVGWYHSHPDFGIFLSDMDLFIHRHFFNLPWQIAHVVDPVRADEGVFVWRSGNPEREGFVVEKDSDAIEFTAADVPKKKAGDVGKHRPVSHLEVEALRTKVRWLSVGLLLSLLIALVWPVVLVAVSQRSVWVRDVLHLPNAPGDSSRLPSQQQAVPLAGDGDNEQNAPQETVIGGTRAGSVSSEASPRPSPDGPGPEGDRPHD
jgi:proteasome lid subunit RPN8/RPN11